MYNIYWHKGMLLLLTPFVFVFAVLAATFGPSPIVPAYEVCIDGHSLLLVADTAPVEAALAEITPPVVEGKELTLASSISYEEVEVRQYRLAKVEAIEPILLKALVFEHMVGAIYIDDKPLVYLSSVEEAETLLNKLKAAHSWTAESEKLVSVDFSENVDVRPVASDAKGVKVISDKEAWTILTTGTDNPEDYIVKEGDSLWQIARDHDLLVGDILAVNNITEDSILSIGQGLTVVTTKPYVNVLATVTGSRHEVIPYKTISMVNPNSSFGVKVKQEGTNGERVLEYQEVRANGMSREFVELSEQVVVASVDRVIEKGTQVTAIASRGDGELYATGGGSLIWPVAGSISQGYRSGHPAIDIAGSTGSAILAADGGYVTYAGWQGGYGNFVVINHGNGMVTRYAHLSAIYVSVGEQVSQGKSIGARGSTGRSSGPHLHFEVLINGSQTNPLNSLQ